MDMSEMSLRTVKYRYGKSNGTDREAEDELQRRGLNSKQLGDVLAEYGLKAWRTESKKAHKVARRKRRSVRNAKNRRHRLRRTERRRQEQIARIARLKEGVTIVGENFDPSASDGSCPSVGKEGRPMNGDDQFDYWADLLCTCQPHCEICEWHRRLRGQYDTRRELGEEMAEIIETSHAIELGVIDLPEGWETIPGRLRHYWAPADRGH